jgi:hypothetical protein
VVDHGRDGADRYHDGRGVLAQALPGSHGSMNKISLNKT